MIINFDLFLGDPPINKPRTANSCIKNRCVVESAMFFFHSEVFPRLSRNHINVLARTPFMHLFAFPNRTQANNAMLHAILLKWDNPKGAFRFGKKILRFTPAEVALVMGLGVDLIVKDTLNMDSNLLLSSFYEQ